LFVFVVFFVAFVPERVAVSRKLEADSRKLKAGS
jgi:hypothetical protein